jgi:hypothetical protein
MEEDDSKARERAKLQDKKDKLVRAANRLGQLVQELGITPDPTETDPFAMDMDEDEDSETIRRSASIPTRQRTTPALLDDIYSP